MKYKVSRTWGPGCDHPKVFSFYVQSQSSLEAACAVEKVIPDDKIPLSTYSVTADGIRETYETHLLVQAEAEGSIPEIYRIRHVVEIEKIEDDQS